MKTLKDLAKVYRKSAAEAIYPGLPWDNYEPKKKRKLKSGRVIDNPNWIKWNKLPKGQKSRAFDEGNLLTKFITSPQNAIDNIASKIGNGYQIVVNVAPEGAEYGRWVHFGTTRMLKRPFAEIATNEPKFVNALNEFMEGESDKMVEGEIEQLDDMFNKAGFTVT
jgi:hypothetical protein